MASTAMILRKEVLNIPAIESERREVIEEDMEEEIEGIVSRDLEAREEEGDDIAIAGIIIVLTEEVITREMM